MVRWVLSLVRILTGGREYLGCLTVHGWCAMCPAWLSTRLLTNDSGDRMRLDACQLVGTCQMASFRATGGSLASARPGSVRKAVRRPQALWSILGGQRTCRNRGGSRDRFVGPPAGAGHDRLGDRGNGRQRSAAPSRAAPLAAGRSAAVVDVAASDCMGSWKAWQVGTLWRHGKYRRQADTGDSLRARCGRQRFGRRIAPPSWFAAGRSAAVVDVAALPPEGCVLAGAERFAVFVGDETIGGGRQRPAVFGRFSAPPSLFAAGRSAAVVGVASSRLPAMRAAVLVFGRAIGRRRAGRESAPHLAASLRL